VAELRPFLRLLRPHLGWALAGVALALVTAAASIGLLALSGWFITASALAGLTVAGAQAFDFLRPGAGVRFFAITRTLGRYGERVVTHEATFRLLARLRVWFYRRIEPLAPGRLLAYRGGDLLGRVVGDIDALDHLYLRVLTPVLVAVLGAAGVTAALALVDGVAALAVLAGLAVAGLVAPGLTAALGGAPGARIATLQGGLRAGVVETLQGLAELTAYGAYPRRRAALAAEEGRLLAAQARMGAVAGLGAALGALASGLTLVAVLWLALGLLEEGRLGAPVAALAVFAALAAFEVVAPLPAAFQYLGRTRAAARRVLEVVEAEPAVRFPDREGLPTGPLAVTLQGVGFAYPGARQEALADLDLAVAPGERLALVGPSGSGKTTVVHLLTRAWDPGRGYITLGGRDLREVSEPALRAAVAVVSQHDHLFNATVRDNLRLGRPRATEEELWQVLAAARLEAFVRGLPEGLDTWLGEGGAALSGGQARRLTVARALLRDAPVMVLDEPTEGLDPATERDLLAALGPALAGRTVLLIGHRLAALAGADRVAVLDRGRLAGAGPPADLYRRGGAFTALMDRSGL
jgi:ATP-binding cassette subfamily C protein CydC